MGKFKLLYDVVMAMKEKDVFNGVLKVEGKKDDAGVLYFVNEFEKNTVSGQVKAKISTDFDYDGKKVKHESTSEFTGPCCHARKFHEHLHLHHQGHHCCKSMSFKEKLSKAAFFLKVLNGIELKEKEDKSRVLALNLAEIPAELKKHIMEKMNDHAVMEEHKHCCVAKEFSDLDILKLGLVLEVNANNEVEKVELVISGGSKDENDAAHKAELKAELSLLW